MTNNLALIEALHTHLQRLMQNLEAQGVSKPRLLLALSGGMDSMALLQALNTSSLRTSFQLSAMYVHHGLSPHADAWLQSCQQRCADIGVPFYYARVELMLDAGVSIEAAARNARYQALQQMCTQLGAHALVTAHHLRDQAETVLLQLLRGAGVKGLSAMAMWEPHSKRFRPWLTTPHAEIQSYAQAEQLVWVEDESNRHLRYDRNYLRHAVLPVLRERYPQAEMAIARAAGHLAEAQQLLDSLATQDLSVCDVHAAWRGQSLAMPALIALGESRAKNLIRHWLHQQCLLAPSTVQLQAYWQQLSQIKADRYLHLPVYATPGKASAFLHHYQGRLYCVTPPTPLPQEALCWEGKPSQRWGDWQLDAMLVKGQGIALKKLGMTQSAITLFKRYGQPLVLPVDCKLWVHRRAGGESFQPDAKRPTRDLKTVFQMLGVPPWQRAFYALVSVERGGSVETIDLKSTPSQFADTPPATTQQITSMQDKSMQAIPPLASVIGLLPDTIDHRWQAGRNAYGLVLRLSPA